VLAPDHQRRKFLAAGVLFLLAAIAALSVDMPIARWAHNDGFRQLDDLDRLIVWSEVFAHGAGVGLILLLVLVLDPANRRRVLRVGIMSFGAGLLANGAKFLVTRTRPHAAELDGTAFSTFDFSTIPHSSTVESFPSGHTAAAVGLAIGLSWLYPRGRWMFMLFAVLAAAQRWSNRDHYVSDTLAGAAIACTFAAFVLGKSALQRCCERFEASPRPTLRVVFPNARALPPRKVRIPAQVAATSRRDAA
jgi:membrane-associated phospholipid phosphatase